MRPIRLRAFEGPIDFPGITHLEPWIAAVPNVPGAAAQPAKVLIVDGDPRTRLLGQSILEQYGFAVTAVPNGPAALAALRRESFCVVVVEMLMPGMDGIEILRHIRRHFPQLPVVAMNSLGEKFDYLNVALKLGADDVLPKPIDPDALVRVVRRQNKSADSARAELRQHARQGTALAGQLFTSARNTAMPCQVVNLSSGGALVTCDFDIDPAQPAMLYVDHFGRFECRIAHVTGAHIGLEFTIGPAKRARLKNMLAADGADGITVLRRLRGHPRVVAPNLLDLVRQNGETIRCEVIDASLDGVSLRTDARLPVGEIVRAGKTRWRIVRHHDHGMAMHYQSEDV